MRAISLARAEMNFMTHGTDTTLFQQQEADSTALYIDSRGVLLILLSCQLSWSPAIEPGPG